MAMLLKLLGMLGKRDQAKLMGPLLSMLGGGAGAGGLAGMLGKFTQAGMGDKVASWVGAGGSEKITPRQVRQALGDDEIGRIAAEAGISKRQASHGLSKLLPDAVDKLSPMGKVPEASELPSSLDDLTKMLGR